MRPLRIPHSPAAPALLALALAACAPESEDRSGLLLPDAVEIRWEGEYNGVDDGLGALVPVDVMAYDGLTGEPRPDVLVHVWTDDDAAAPIAVDAVTVLTDLPESLPDAAPAAETWDAAHDRFVVLHTEGTGDGSSRPADLDLRTDADGIARLYLFVDAFPTVDRAFGPIRVMVAAGDADELFWLEPR
jgi:hypothetical protein